LIHFYKRMIWRPSIFGEFYSSRFKYLDLTFSFRNFSVSRRSKLEILGLREDASKREIRKAYLELSKRYHPDVDDSVESKIKYQLIREAYDELYNESFNPYENGINQSQSQGQTHSEYYYQWKRRTEKQQDLNDWLRKIQKDAREKDKEYKLKMQAMKEKQDNESWDDPILGKNNSVSHELDKEYLEFERRFINNWDILVQKISLSLPKRKAKEAANDWTSKSKVNETASLNNPILELWRIFLPWYLRWILGSAPIAIVVVAITLLG